MIITNASVGTGPARPGRGGARRAPEVSSGLWRRRIWGLSWLRLPGRRRFLPRTLGLWRFLASPNRRRGCGVGWRIRGRKFRRLRRGLWRERRRPFAGWRFFRFRWPRRVRMRLLICRLFWLKLCGRRGGIGGGGQLRWDWLRVLRELRRRRRWG